MILDKIKKKLNLKDNTKTELVVKKSNFDINDVETILNQNTQKIYEMVLVWSLYSEYKYSDISIYDKCKNDLISSLSTLGYVYKEADEESLEMLFKQSDAYNLFTNTLKENLDYYTKNPIKYEWGTLNMILKQIVDKSLMENYPVNTQIARIIFGRDYYNKYKYSEPSILYKNLIVVISKEEFISWMNNEEDCFLYLLIKAKNKMKHFNCYVSEDYENTFVRELISSKQFIIMKDMYPTIIDSVLKSKFHTVFVDVYPEYKETTKVNDENNVNLYKNDYQDKAIGQVETEVNQNVLNSVKNGSVDKFLEKSDKSKGTLELVPTLSAIDQNSNKLINQKDKVLSKSIEINKHGINAQSKTNEIDVLKDSNISFDFFLQKFSDNSKNNNKPISGFLESCQQFLEDIELK